MENMLPTNKGEQHETLLLQTNSMLDHYDIAYTNAYPWYAIKLGLLYEKYSFELSVV